MGHTTIEVVQYTNMFLSDIYVFFYEDFLLVNQLMVDIVIFIHHELCQNSEEYQILEFRAATRPLF